MAICKKWTLNWIKPTVLEHRAHTHTCIQRIQPDCIVPHPSLIGLPRNCGTKVGWLPSYQLAISLSIVVWASLAGNERKMPIKMATNITNNNSNSSQRLFVTVSRNAGCSNVFSAYVDGWMAEWLAVPLCPSPLGHGSSIVSSLFFCLN